MQQYTVEELNAKGIFELRALAKEAGISAPTKINKAELVDGIYKISNGLMEPPAAPRRGRPKKVKPAPVTFTAVQPEEVEANENIPSAAPRRNEQRKGYYDQPRYSSYRDNPSDGRRGARSGDERQKRYVTPSRENREYPPRTAFCEPHKFDEEGEVLQREGYLEIYPENYGFLRVRQGEFHELDAYISSMKIKQYFLREGDYVKAQCRAMQEDKPPAVITVTEINGFKPEDLGKRKNFDEMVPIYPDERIRLETTPREYATRCIDLVSPIGKGQRGIIVSPPKAGKTTLLKMIASAISQNYPDIELMVLLIDERPEEVTDMQRSIKGDVVYSTFDELPENHTKVAESLLERAKRLVECGKDVVILLDSLTRLTRAYNATVPPTGRTLSGGIDPGALHSPKRFFGSARNIENGGSLTIIATALIDTGSRMDDVIFEEFKGTGNMEIHLDRKLSEKRIFPAIDLAKSGTRKEELLLTQAELEGTWGIRKMLSNADNAEATEHLLGMIVKSNSNKEFIDNLSNQIRLIQKEGYTIRGSK